MQTAGRAPQVAVVSAVVLAVALLIVFIGYPDWLWFPLTIGFWGALIALLISVAFIVRSRLANR